MKEVLDRIVRTRKDKKISQKEISELLGISQAAYAKMESGASISVERIFKIAEILNVSVEFLLDIEKSKTANTVNEGLMFEIDNLKKRIIELEEQLNDKRKIIDFLSANDLLYDIAYHIERNKEGFNEANETKRINRNFYDIDSLLKEFDDRPYNREDKESMINYILKNFKDLKGFKKE